jgi:peptidoglycan hydrolase-like protein with peptidoglycan-binding domain
MSTVTLQPWLLAKKPMSGYPVQSLQRLLRAHDHAIPASFVDGVFGPSTETKVKAFQQSHPPLVVDGQVGKNTWLKLIITTQPGSTGEAVKALQEVIKAQDLSDGEAPPVIIDGIFGPKTKAFVTGWQKFVGLTVDGIVGPKTWQSLLSGLPF